MDKKDKLYQLLDENPELYHDIDALHEKVGYTQKHYTERYAQEWKNLNPGKVPEKNEDTENHNETMNKDNDVSEKAMEKIQELAEQEEQNDEPQRQTQQKTKDKNSFQEQLRVKRESNGTVDVDNSAGGRKEAKPEQESFLETDKSTNDIVNEADTQEEKQRRNEFLNQLDKQTKTRSDTPKDPDKEYIEIDEDLAKQLIGMPFGILDGIDTWDGWQLSETEKTTNSKLFVKYAEERGIPLTASTLFFLSMGATIGTRVTMRVNHYRKKKSNTSSEHFQDEPPPEDNQNDQTENESGGFDPANPETWE